VVLIVAPRDESLIARADAGPDGNALTTEPGHEVLGGAQPQDRQGSRAHDPALAVGAGGSGHRVSRKRRKSDQRRARREGKPVADPERVSLLPMEIHVGDQFTDQDFEWEVLTHPAVPTTARACARGSSGPDSQRLNGRSPGRLTSKSRFGEAPANNEHP
jgi:hypothetical protein